MNDKVTDNLYLNNISVYCKENILDYLIFNHCFQLFVLENICWKTKYQLQSSLFISKSDILKVNLINLINRSQYIIK